MGSNDIRYSEWLESSSWKEDGHKPIYFERPSKFDYYHLNLNAELRLVYSLHSFKDFLIRIEPKQIEQYYTKPAEYFSEFLKNFFYSYRSGRLYLYMLPFNDKTFDNVVRLKAIKILLESLRNYFKMKFQYKFVIQLDLGNMKEFDESQFILKLTNQLTSAFLSGADFYYPIDDKFESAIEKIDYKKIVSPTFRILKKESHLNTVCDPTRGSYYLDNRIHELCRDIWNNFKQLRLPPL
ncbi:MAG: hypothetical protein H6621_08180 [Halobacteriovoraceae bacterium]|nr:hypothetical protein [Halobacteriovoraceae bacterium]